VPLYVQELVLVALCLGGALAAQQQQNYPPQFPRANATELLSNDRVNVWDAYWLKNQPTPMHRHIFDVISITVQGGAIRVTNADGKVSQGESHLGQANFSRRGLTHSEEGLSDVPQRKIFLELKSMAMPAAAGAEPGAFPPPGTTKLVDNDRLIAWDYSWAAGQKVQVDAKNFDTVTVFLTGGTIRSTDAKGTAMSVERKPGDVVYAAHGPETRSEEAVSGSPRAIVVQLK
jgi:hypothetical protein